MNLFQRRDDSPLSAEEVKLKCDHFIVLRIEDLKAIQELFKLEYWNVLESAVQ